MILSAAQGEGFPVGVRAASPAGVGVNVGVGLGGGAVEGGAGVDVAGSAIMQGGG